MVFSCPGAARRAYHGRVKVSLKKFLNGVKFYHVKMTGEHVDLEDEDVRAKYLASFGAGMTPYDAVIMHADQRSESVDDSMFAQNEGW
ncbi:MAG: hypothetical protein KDD43_14750 [Bdellovibrionales bacterium]|nr:hypothetical protein [Bdellovibrionales bacterium]